HHRQRSAADRRHRRRAVRFKDVRDHADRVWELVFGWQHLREGTLRERAMADFAAARARHASDFADREGREVVVEHEALPRLALERLDLLRVVVRSKCAGDERLCFTAGEDGRSVRAGQHAGLNPDRTDLVELAAVETDAMRQHFLAKYLLLEFLE